MSAVRWPMAIGAAALDRPEPPPPSLLPGVVRTHLDELTGRYGIYQHARGRTPDPGQGYCTDDVARAAIVDVLHGRQVDRAGLADSLARSVDFLVEAYVPGTGRLRNFRDDDGNWLEHQGSADAHARGVQALGMVVGEGTRGTIGSSAAGLLEELLPAARDLEGFRPWAHVILGCCAALRSDEPPAAAAGLVEDLAGRLLGSFDRANDEWPWPEPVATYENALLAQALIEGGEWLADRRMVEQGLATLDFLLAGQIAPAGYIELVGNQGWWPGGGLPARFDQQPIDAAALVEACGVAWRITGERAWLAELERAYAWFGGWNAIGIAVAEPSVGGCGDGLSVIGVSANQGAESTLAWLAATEWVRISREGSIRPGRRRSRAAG